MAIQASVRRQILRNTLSGWGYKILKVALAIFSNPLLIAGLGKEGYALLALLATLIGFSELTDLGVRPALGRELAQARAEGNAAAFNRLVSSALAVYMGLFALLGTALVLATPTLARLMAGPGSPLTAEALLLLRTYGLFALAVAFVRPAFSAVLAAANRFDRRNQAESLFTLLQGLGIIATLSLTDWGLAGWVGVTVVAQLINLGQILYYAFRSQPGLRVGWAWVGMAEIRQLYAFGSLLFVSQWARKIKFDADPLVIARYLGPAQVALYKPPHSLMANVRPLLTTFAGQLYPVTTQLYAQGSLAQAQALFLAASRYTLLLALPVAAFFGGYGPEIMHLWLGRVLTPAEVALAGQVLAGWAFIELAVALEGSAWSVLFGQKKVRFVIWVEVVAALLNIGASVWLVQVTELGLLAVVLPSIALEAIIRPLYALRAAQANQMPLGSALRGLYARPLAVGLGLAALVIALRWALPTYGWLWLAAHGSVLGLAFAGLVWAIGMPPAERATIKQLIQRRLPKHLPAK